MILVFPPFYSHVFVVALGTKFESFWNFAENIEHFDSRKHSDKGITD